MQDPLFFCSIFPLNRIVLENIARRYGQAFAGVVIKRIQHGASVMSIEDSLIWTLQRDETQPTPGKSGCHLLSPQSN